MLGLVFMEISVLEWGRARASGASIEARGSFRRDMHAYALMWREAQPPSLVLTTLRPVVSTTLRRLTLSSSFSKAPDCSRDL
jgi:hypothetical protein